MKKLISCLLAMFLTMALVIPTGFAADTKPVLKSKLTTTELKIANAYLNTLKTLDTKYLNAVKYPGIKYSAAGVIPSNYKLTILRPTFTKVKDKSGLNRIDVSGLMVLTDGTELATMNVTSGILIKLKGTTPYAYYEVRGKEEVKSFEDLSTADQDKVYEWLTEVYGDDIATDLVSVYLLGDDYEANTSSSEDNNKPTIPPVNASSTDSKVKTLTYNQKDYGEPKSYSTANLGQWGRINNFNVMGSTFDVDLKVNSVTKDNDGYSKYFSESYAVNKDKLDFYKVEVEGRSFNFKNANDRYVNMISPSSLIMYGLYSNGKVTFYQNDFEGGFAWAYSISNTSAINGTYSSINSPAEIYSKGYVYLAAPKGKALEYMEISKGLDNFYFKLK